MGGCISKEDHLSEALNGSIAPTTDDSPSDKKRPRSPPVAYKKNQVVPEPTNSQVNTDLPGSTTEAPLTTVEVDASRQEKTDSSSRSGKTDKQAKTATTSITEKQDKTVNSKTPELWETYVQELLALSKPPKSIPEASQLQELLRRAPAWLAATVLCQPDQAATAFEACARAASKLANKVLMPIVTHAERTFSNSTASSSSSGASWDRLDVGQLLASLEDGSIAEYGVGLAVASAPAKMASELLVLLSQNPKQTKVQVPIQACVVPALSKVASMLGIIFFRQVVLESPEALEAKMEQVRELREALCWADNRHLAVCLEPHARAMLAGLQQAADFGGELRLNLQVQRGNVFGDALEQASRLKLPPLESSGLVAQCYKIFPSFVDEWTSGSSQTLDETNVDQQKTTVEAGEGHGPRKEFFALVAQGMCGQGQGKTGNDNLFSYNRSAGCYWYNSTLQCSKELQGAYSFAGWLVGQSIANRAPLGLPLAPIILKHMLQGLDTFVPDMTMLRAFDMEAASNISKVAELPRDQLCALMEMEGLPRDMTSQQYTQHAVHSLLMKDVEWQARAMAAGFQSAIEPRVLKTWCVDAEALASVLQGGNGGEEDIDIRQIFRVVMDQELTGMLGDLFWQVVTSWSQEKKQMLLKFVTGSSHRPLPGSELFKIQAPFMAFGLAEHKMQLGMLPQAHTCDNLLELPNYWESLLQVKGYKTANAIPKDQLPSLKEECSHIIDDRLTLAVTCFSGYGLDQRDTDD